MWRSLRRREYAGSAGRRLPGTCTPNPLFRPRAPRPEDGMALHQRQGQVPCLARTPCPRPDTVNVPAAPATKLVINPRGLRHDPPGSGHPLFDRLDEAWLPEALPSGHCGRGHLPGTAFPRPGLPGRMI